MSTLNLMYLPQISLSNPPLAGKAFVNKDWPFYIVNNARHNALVSSCIILMVFSASVKRPVSCGMIQ